MRKISIRVNLITFYMILKLGSLPRWNFVIHFALHTNGTSKKKESISSPDPCSLKFKVAEFDKQSNQKLLITISMQKISSVHLLNLQIPPIRAYFISFFGATIPLNLQPWVLEKIFIFEIIKSCICLGGQDVLF